MLIRRPDPKGVDAPDTVDADESLQAALQAADDTTCIQRLGTANNLDDDDRAAAIERLKATDSTRLQQVLLNHMVPSIRDAEVLELLTELRSDNAGLRNQIIDGLGRTPPDAPGRALLEHQVQALMVDPDTDTRILAVNLAQAMQTESLLPALERVLKEEETLNVVAAALDAVATLGGPDQADTVRLVARRFESDAFIRFSVEQVLAALPGLDNEGQS